jgi:hypothetical protein
MKTRTQDILLLLAILIIGLSFFIPNEFNEEIRERFFELVIHNPLGYLALYALVFIPIILYSIYRQRIGLALWISFAFIVFQIFSVGFTHLISMKWYEYLINVFGFGIVLFTYNRLLKTGLKSNIIIFTLSALYIFGLVLTIIIYPDLDSGYSILLYSLIVYFLGRSIKRTNNKAVRFFVLFFYIISFLLLTINFKCNIKFISDMGIANWEVENLLSRCSSFYCWGIGAIMINWIVIIKYKTMLNTRS